MVKNIAILGSTGSIGTSALKVIDALGDDYRVKALTAHSNSDLLAEQVRKYSPDYAAVTNPACIEKFESETSGLNVKTLAGSDAMSEIASMDDIDTILAAVVGASGLPAILAAAEAGKVIAIANKEPLVIAGGLLMETARQNNAEILPVDSEHSAIFQAMQAGNKNEVRKIILTSSGGPFRDKTPAEIENVTPEQALAHPVWSMGDKITIDSATMMNKSLEIIEARWLFDIPVENIEVLIHPESVIHSMVEFVDGSIIAQLGTPDMSLPIQYALTYPNRMEGITEHLKLENLKTLSFRQPDMETFRSLKLAYQVAEQGDSEPVVFNAANEAAVDLFLEGKIRFPEIVELVEECLKTHSPEKNLNLKRLLDIDKWAKDKVREFLKVKQQGG